MPSRSWFYASDGQQQGPYPEIQFRDLIARGTVTADTLVWSEGMTGWQRAGDIPGLLSGASSPPAVPRSGAPQTSAGGYGGGALSIDFGIWDFTWRSLALLFGVLLVIPLPWAILMYCRWLVSCVHVPQRPNLGFAGRIADLMWLYGFAILLIVQAWAQSRILGIAINLGQLVIYWMLIKWFVSNLTSDGKPLGLQFSGSFWGFVGWALLVALSLITIVGWAWVYVAQIRWMCRHIEGTQREITFNATGLELLWRSLVLFIGCFFIIPIPWVYRWFLRWKASQTVLVERGTQTSA
jgi:GYF domain 2